MGATRMIATLAALVLMADPHLEWGLLPAIDYSSDYGLGLGAIGALYWAEPGSPLYRYAVQAQAYANTGGQQYHYVSFDAPGLWGSPYRVTTQLTFDSSRFAPWYGAGNHPALDDSAASTYYRFERISPNGRVQGRRKLTSWLQAYAQYQFTWTWIRLYDGSLAQAELPLGSSGGRYAVASVGLLVDTRNSEISPTRGQLVELGARGAAHALGSQYEMVAVFASASAYHALWTRLVLAARVAFDDMWGGVPFDHLSDVGILFPQNGLGGATTVRGLLQSEYVGDAKLLGNLEARLHLVDFGALGQRFKLGVLGFADCGRVWMHGAVDPPGANLHAGGGGGVRLTWGSYFVIRGDVGFSPGEVRAYVDVGQIF